MKLTLKTILLAAALALASRQAHANVALNLDFENLYSTNLLTLAPANGTVVLLASTLDSSFGNLTLATTQFTDPAQTDDIVLGKWTLGAGSGSAGVFNDAITFNLSGNLNAGDPLMLVWYPNVNSASAAPGYSKAFGSFRSDTALAGSDIGFIVPADGSGLNLFAFSQSAGGDVLNSSFVANQSTIAVVPEPSSIALVAMGCIGAIVIRRRKLARG